MYPIWLICSFVSVLKRKQYYVPLKKEVIGQDLGTCQNNEVSKISKKNPNANMLVDNINFHELTYFWNCYIKRQTSCVD